MRFIPLLLFIFSSVSLLGQELSGLVSDLETGEPLAFVNVYEENSNKGTNSDESGEFTFAVDKGAHQLTFSIIGYESLVLELEVTQDTFIAVLLSPTNLEITEVTVEAKKTRIGNQIIRKLIANKSKILNNQSNYSTDNYVKTQMEKWFDGSEEEDSIFVEEGFQTVYLSEKASRQHFSGSKFKAEMKGESINSSDSELQRSARMDVNRSFRGSSQAVEYNPIEFFRTAQQANIELYDNSINNASLSDRPISSPLGNGAFLNYRFRLQEIKVRDGDSIFRVSVDPIFKKAPLFHGNLIVNGSDWVLISADLNISNNVINSFQDFNFQVNYENVGKNVWKATQKSFHYSTKIGKDEYKVNTQIIDSNIDLQPNFSKKFFGSEIISYSEQSLERDSSIWTALRPKSIHISSTEREFKIKQDSIYDYEHSQEFYMAQDSNYNRVTALNVLWSGVNYRNRGKGITFGFNSLVASIRPLGVGGYRQSLGGYVEKEFATNNSIRTTYNINYGFNNRDLKGSVRLGYTYMPQKFARVFARVGDTYDLITLYESLDNILSRGNYIRNRRFGIGHVFEVFNGLYVTTEMQYADKRSIADVQLADWGNFLFGENNAPAAFERYKSFIFTADIVYKFGQKYITKGRKKVVIGNNYPTLQLIYKKGIPSIWSSEVNFDHLELRMSQEMPNTKFGNTNWTLFGGSYLNRKSLRFIEYKYFRGSTPLLLAEPLRDYQLLGPTLSTNNSYFQAMAIHHFNGFIMDKIPGINWLQLEVITGAGALYVPDQNFAHGEFYAGLGRKFRFKGEQFQVALYGATSNNSAEKWDISYKIGLNVLNAFTGKWAY